MKGKKGRKKEFRDARNKEQSNKQQTIIIGIRVIIKKTIKQVE